MADNPQVRCRRDWDVRKGSNAVVRAAKADSADADTLQIVRFLCTDSTGIEKHSLIFARRRYYACVGLPSRRPARRCDSELASFVCKLSVQSIVFQSV